MNTDKKMNADVVLGLFSGLVSIYWIIQSLKFPPGTTDGVPGAGYFPILVSVVLMILSVVSIIQGLKNKNIYFNVKEWGSSNKKMLVLTALLIGVFFILWYFTTYIIACIVLTLGLGLTYKLSLKGTIILSLIFSFGTYYVFNNLLQVMLKLR